MDKNTEQKLRRILCEQLVISLFASTALGFFVKAIPEVCSQVQSQVQEQAQEQVRVLAGKEAWAQERVRVLAGKQAQEQVRVLAGKQAQAQSLTQASQAFRYQFKLLVISTLCFMLMSLLLLSRNQISLFLTGQLIIFLPKKCIVELKAFHQQIQKLKPILWEPLVIGLFLFTALGFILTRIIIVNSQMDRLGQAYAQREELTQKEEEEEALAQAQKEALTLTLALAQAQKEALTLGLAQVKALPLQYQFLPLGISALCFILMLLFSLRRNQVDLRLMYQLIIFLPEEYIVDLEDFYQQIKSEESSIWVIRRIMLKNVLEVLWAFHVQMNVENLWLPKNKGHNKIDD